MQICPGFGLMPVPTFVSVICTPIAGLAVFAATWAVPVSEDPPVQPARAAAKVRAATAREKVETSKVHSCISMRDGLISLDSDGLPVFWAQPAARSRLQGYPAQRLQRRS